MTETKICSKCKTEYPITEFRWRNKAKGTLHSQCKSCEKARDKIHYQESKERRDTIRETAFLQKSNNLGAVDAALAKGCCKCGETRPYVLDFHHRDPSKKVNTINHMIKSSSYEKVLEELEKCDVLCANCHREFHHLERTKGITYDEYINAWVAQLVVAPD